MRVTLPEWVLPGGRQDAVGAHAEITLGDDAGLACQLATNFAFTI